MSSFTQTVLTLFHRLMIYVLAMLEREGGDSPSPEDEIDGGLSIDEVMKII